MTTLWIFESKMDSCILGSSRVAEGKWTERKASNAELHCRRQRKAEERMSSTATSVFAASRRESDRAIVECVCNPRLGEADIF
jgi:hypothetical protein